MTRLVVLLLGLSCAGSAFAREPAKVAIVPVVVGTEAIGMSTIVSAVGEAADLRVGLSLMTMEDLFVAGGDTALQAVQACGSDLSCVSERLRSVDASMGLLVVYNAAMDSPLLSLRLFDTREEAVIAVRSGPGAAEPDLLAPRIRALSAEIFTEAGFAEAARLVVQVEPVDARVTVGPRDEPDPGTSHVFTLSPGHYPVQASLEGYESSRVDVTLIGGEVETLAMSLEEDRTVFQSPWFWVAVGAVVVGGATAATVVAINSGQDEYCFCIEGPDGSCPGC